MNLLIFGIGTLPTEGSILEDKTVPRYQIFDSTTGLCGEVCERNPSIMNSHKTNQYIHRKISFHGKDSHSALGQGRTACLAIK